MNTFDSLLRRATRSRGGAAFCVAVAATALAGCGGDETASSRAGGSGGSGGAAPGAGAAPGTGGAATTSGTSGGAAGGAPGTGGAATTGTGGAASYATCSECTIDSGAQAAECKAERTACDADTKCAAMFECAYNNPGCATDASGACCTRKCVDVYGEGDAAAIALFEALDQCVICDACRVVCSPLSDEYCAAYAAPSGC